MSEEIQAGIANDTKIAGRDKLIEMSFCGTSGIKKPVDFHGAEIKIGDTLTFDYLDPYFKDKDVARYVGKPLFLVQKHKSGKGLYAKGINQELYLHDFRFKYCEIIKLSPTSEHSEVRP